MERCVTGKKKKKEEGGIVVKTSWANMDKGLSVPCWLTVWSIMTSGQVLAGWLLAAAS